MNIPAKISIDEFMTFFRDEDCLSELSVDDRIEDFRTILLGSTDFKKELFDEIFSDYCVSHLDVIEVK